ncbi:hypothetical protein [Microbulbifer sp. SH-1]|uniref:hypothetical protein n=1 Tax=Microbulbifer sp. SH-1 TaxID=2681547 RepID=UPI00140D33C4|nr:hypothetical protein [Microbulbifer sp. SH-1]
MKTHAPLRALAMFEQLLAGDSFRSIGAKYGLCPERVRQIVNQVRWQLVHREWPCGENGGDACWKIPSMRKQKHYWIARAKELRLEYANEVRQKDAYEIQVDTPVFREGKTY